MRQHSGRAAVISEHISPPDQSERDVQREYMSSRFLVDREAMAPMNVSLHASSVPQVKFYGAQHYAASFIFEPMDTRSATYSRTRILRSSVDAGMEVRVARFHNFYVKSMVLAGGPLAFFKNPTACSQFMELP